MTSKQIALTQAISGLGGIGKTQMALEYAYQYQKSYHDIVWIRASSPDALIASYVELASLLQIDTGKEPDQTKLVEAVKDWLHRRKGWLLILDNIEDLSLVDRYVPVHRQGAVLLTTRRNAVGYEAEKIQLDIMSENDSVLFLLKRVGSLSLSASISDASPDEIKVARDIAKSLGGLPLAIDQAGAYRYLKAEPYYYQALQIRKQKLGEAHPYV